MKVIVFQTDDRLDKPGYGQALYMATQTIKSATEKAGYDYEFYADSLGLGRTIRPDSRVPQYYADVAIMNKLLMNSEYGDILIYIDTDVVSVNDDSIRGLVWYIENSDKHFFITSTITAFNAGLFAIKVNKEMKMIFPNIDWYNSSEYIDTKFGRKYTPDEVPVINAIRDNYLNINNQIAFLPNDEYNVRPEYKVLEDNFDDGLPRPTEKTKLIHFLTKQGKNELMKYFGVVV